MAGGWRDLNSHGLLVWESGVLIAVIFLDSSISRAARDPKPRTSSVTAVHPRGCWTLRQSGKDGAYGTSYCPGHARVKGNDRADRLAGKATLASGLLLGRSEVLRNLRHYLQAQSQGHLDDRRSSLKGRERTVVNQTNTGTVSKATSGKILRDGVERYMGFSEHIDTILNWTGA